MWNHSPRLTRVKLRNYRSYAECDVALKPLTVIVGENGSGKSNFLDAIQFVVDSLTSGLDWAIQERGGLPSVLHRGLDNSVVELEIEFELPAPGVLSDPSIASNSIQLASYQLSFEAISELGYRIQHESLKVRRQEAFISLFAREYESVGVQKGMDLPPELDSRSRRDTLFSMVSRLHNYVDFAATLRGILTRLPNPEFMRIPTSASLPTNLTMNGSNIANVLNRWMSDSPEVIARIDEYLRVIVPGFDSLNPWKHGDFAGLSFSFMLGDSPHNLGSFSVSEGTLRALGLLVTVLEPRLPHSLDPGWLLLLEEPENNIHPGAAAVLMDAFHEALLQRQLIFTTHSPDLIDRLDPETDQLLVAEWHEGRTILDVPDAASEKTLRDRLTTPGELLRQRQLQPAAVQSLPWKS